MLKIVQACGDHSVEPANQISSVWERYYILSCSRSCSETQTQRDLLVVLSTGPVDI